MPQAPEPSRPAGHGAPGRHEPPPQVGSSFVEFLKYVGILLGTGAAIVGAAIWVLEHPDTTVARWFRQASSLAVPAENAVNDEYLVFLEEDTPANRQAVLAVSPTLEFVAESFLPNVVVVRIADGAQPIVERIGGLDAVRMVLKYNPSLGCH